MIPLRMHRLGLLAFSVLIIAIPINAREPSASPGAAQTLPSNQEIKECLARLGVESWRNEGFTGKGITIALLDSGFRGYKDQLGKALPYRVTCRSFRSDGNLEARDSIHGLLCAEVIHSLAPDAQLLFVNWDPDQADQFLKAARWARDRGATVISCSLIMPSWSDGSGGGPIHDELRKTVGSGRQKGDVVFFACAGNTAQRHWSGRFRGDSLGRHQWSNNETANEIKPWGTEMVSVEMCWRGPADYNLEIYDSLLERPLAQSLANAEILRTNAVARFNPQAGHRYQIVVRRQKSDDGPFHVVALGGGLEYSTATDSIPFPADGAEIIAVGAVDATGQRTLYSSCGSSANHLKPDLVATVPFPSRLRSRPFSGTSAAAPQAAGLAALVWSAHPDWCAAQIRQALQEAARDLGPKGHDCETGYGLITLPPLPVRTRGAAELGKNLPAGQNGVTMPNQN